MKQRRQHDWKTDSLGGASDVCTFIESGTISVGWDGSVAPCLPLLHTHVSYLHGSDPVSVIGIRAIFVDDVGISNHRSTP